MPSSTTSKEWTGTEVMTDDTTAMMTDEATTTTGR